mgnify:CR=1 FL=1
MKGRYLFKAKRIDNGEWVTGHYVKGLDIYAKEVHLIFEPTTIFYSSGETDGWSEVDPSTICQCTGLKDKNGKLIWEGDIILFQRDNDDCPFPNKDTKKRLGKVFYKGFRTTFAIGMGKNGSGSINDDLWKYVQNGNRVEVIGNIFDNKELLESEEK